MTLPTKALDLLNAADGAKVAVDEAANVLRTSTDQLASAQSQVDSDRGNLEAAKSDQAAKVNAVFEYLRSYFDGTLPVQPPATRPAPSPRPNMSSQGR